MAKSHKTCMEQTEIIDTFGTYHARAGILSERQDRRIPSWVWSLLVAVRCPVVRKSSSSEQTRDKVRRRFTLSVTARVGGTTGQAPMLLVDLTAVVVRDSLK